MKRSRPRETIRLYLQAAEDLLALWGWGSYVQAAGCLARVHALYEDLGEQDAWQALIQDLRERYRPLRALEEELNRAGL